MDSAAWSKFDVYNYESFILFQILVNKYNVAKLQMTLRYLYVYNTSTSDMCLIRETVRYLRGKLFILCGRTNSVNRYIVLSPYTKVTRACVSCSSVRFPLNFVCFVSTHEPRNAIKSYVYWTVHHLDR